MRRFLRWPHVIQRPVKPAERGPRTSIAWRLRWSYLISSTLPLLIVGALLLSLNLNAQQNSVYANQRTTVTRVARDISRYITDLQQQLERFALQVRPSSSQWTQSALNLAARNYPNLLDLAVIDQDAREQLRVRRSQLVPHIVLRDLSSDSGVMLALREGRSSYSPIAFNNEGERSFVMILPVPNDSGTIVGVLRAEISAEPIARELRDGTSSARSYTYLIASATGAVLIDDGHPNFAAPRQLDRLLASGSGVAEYDGARGQHVIGAVATITVGANNESTAWSVIVEQPASVAFASVRGSVLLLTLLVVLVGVLALLWAFRQARRFLMPLEALRSGAAALGAGHLDHRIMPLGDDELGSLAQTFNHMAEHLQQSLDEIEQQNDRLRRGLALARDIQIGLLPDRPPWNVDEIAVFARSLPAYEVGGDFYTYLALSEGRAAIAIGDISGKGVGAALLMALTASAVESQGRQIEHPAEVLAALNKLLSPRLQANHMNAALLFAVIDPYQRIVRIANAGMIAPVLVSPTGSHFIDIGGLPIGALDEANYQEVMLPLGPGDALLLLSDGVVEAHNAHNELFGFERLEQAITACEAGGDVRALVELVLDQVHAHMGDAEQHDDITIVAVRPVALAADRRLDEERTITYAAV